MKTLIVFVAILVLIVSFTSWGAGGGAGEVGNGGDRTKIEDGSAWFLGEHVIRYCVDISQDFGVTASFADEQIQEAFRIWGKYFSKKGINDVAPPLRLSVAAVVMSSCDGTQDLKFYLGASAPEVTQYKAQFEDPVGFSQRLSYDKFKGWGAGFIWIAPSQMPIRDKSFPNWARKNQLLGILLHELGHVYGFAHFENTIMSGNISWLLDRPFHYGGAGSKILSEIDHESELYYRMDDHDLEYEGTFHASRAWLKELMGRDPARDVKIRITRKKSDPALLYSYIVRDSRGEVSLPMQLGFGESFDRQYYVFRRVISTKTTEGRAEDTLDFYKGNYGTRPGWIQATSGKKVSILFRENYDYSPVSVEIPRDADHIQDSPADFMALVVDNPDVTAQ